MTKITITKGAMAKLAATTMTGSMTMTDELVKRLLNAPADGLGTENLCLEAAARIEALNQEAKDLKKLVFAAYCEGFSDGKDGGWIVGPSNQPWKASDAHRMLKTMEAKP